MSLMYCEPRWAVCAVRWSVRFGFAVGRRVDLPLSWVLSLCALIRAIQSRAASRNYDRPCVLLSLFLRLLSLRALSLSPCLPARSAARVGGGRWTVARRWSPGHAICDLRFAAGRMVAYRWRGEARRGCRAVLPSPFGDI
jgi:hypothetical protein